MRVGVALVLLLVACAPSELRMVPSAVGAAIHTQNGLFAEYRTDGQRGPVLWPLCAPGGETLTREFPFAEVEGEHRDHPHHESCWFAHGSVQGVDFWQGSGRIVVTSEPEIQAERSEISQLSQWRDEKGAVVCSDRRTYCFREHDDAGWRAVDIEVLLSRDAGALHFGDTKEGTMAMRLRKEFCLEGEGARGSVQNSEGVTGKSVWGKSARWVAYTAELDGVPHTVAIFDAPGNHGYPTHWHARGYGLFAANPFGLHDFTGAPKGAGDYTLPKGGVLHQRYRIWMRRGPCEAASIEAAWQSYCAGL